MDKLSRLFTWRKRQPCVLSSESAPVMHVMAIQDSKGLDATRIAQTLLPRGRFELVPSSDLLPDTLAQPTLSAEQPSPVQAGTIAALLDLFAEGKTFGSLVTVPDEIADALPALKAHIQPDERDDIFQREAKQALAPLVDQAELLGRQYDAVVANPPYMGGKGMNALLKSYVGKSYKDGKSDLFSAFIERGFTLISQSGYHSMVTMENWMFLNSFQNIREKILNSYYIISMAHMPYLGKGGTSMGISFGTAATVIRKARIAGTKGNYCCIRYFETDENFVPIEFPPRNERLARTSCDDFKKIPGSPVAYWLSPNAYDVFEKSQKFEDVA
ncbi:Eco57I restriction-modification methylase domain-containing protein [Sinorhizobium fredii]|uniref:Eco57I restriction-modification methylase domain-containing protein n=1 Tax=Rhizobium fredii TaxID=380 RepID=UPI003516F83C